jgi:hypothetical protein
VGKIRPQVTLIPFETKASKHRSKGSIGVAAEMSVRTIATRVGLPLAAIAGPTIDDRATDPTDNARK